MNERLLKRRRVSGSKLPKFSSALLLLMLAGLFAAACTIDERQSGIPSKAEEAIGAFTEDFNGGRFDKIYREASEEWRDRISLEQSNETFRTLKERLGAIREREFTSGRRQQNPSGNLPGNSLVVRYNAKFERAEAMETFTLIERDGRYLLAGYSASSDVLK